MKYILGLYEFIEMQTLSKAKDLLDDSYKRETLNEDEKLNIIKLQDEINQNDK